MQPEAGPSRLPAEPQSQELPRKTTISETFSSDADFIPFVASDDDKPKRSTREWDRGKPEWDRDRNRRRDLQAASRKRRWEESEQDGTWASRRQGGDVNGPNTRSRKTPWTVYVDWDSCRNVAELLHKEVEAFLLYISPTPVEHEVRWMVVQLISSSIKKSYPDAEVLPFGSFGTRLYLPSGDIDLCVLSQSLAYSDRVVALRSLANIVKRTGITDKVTVIAKAKVPIIKFITSYGRFSVDISMNQANGMKALNMINKFLEEFPALRALVLIVKSFLNQRGMNEVYSGGLGSYAIVCLAVSFLQMHPKLRRAEIDPSRNLGVLVMEFFELYGKYFNYVETGISLRRGGSYFNKARRGWQDYNKMFLLSIEDPGDISNDISRGSYGIKNVRQTFAGAFELMKSAAYVSAGILSARQSGRSVDLCRGSEDARDPEDMSILASILASILGVSQETINHRRLVQEVYDQGTLTRLLGVDPRSRLGTLPARANGDGNNPGPSANADADRPRRTREAQSIAAAWSEADMMLDSDEEGGTQARERNSQNGHRRTRDDAHESESRYNIAQSRSGNMSRAQSQGGPTRKRRRTGSAQDVSTAATATAAVFVAIDDDEEEEKSEEVDQLDSSEYREAVIPGPDSSDDGLEEIERAYAAAADELADEDSAYTKGSKKGKGAASKRRKPLGSDQRRAYWASKGLRVVDSDSA